MLWRAAWQIARKDLLIEARTKEVTITTTYFTVIVVVLSSLAFYVDPNTARRIAPGVMWVALAFAGLLGVLRSWAREREDEALLGLLLLPIPRASIYLGKLIGNMVFLSVVLLVLLPLTGVLFHVDVRLVVAASPILLLGCIGFVCAGTLFGALTVQSRARDMTLAIVVFPLLMPALLGGVVATRELFLGAPLHEVLWWLEFLAGFDLLFLAGAFLLFDYLLSD